MISLDESKKQSLIEAAKAASDKAYSPYSKFKVGAALLTKNGNIFSACNVENASYSLTSCAERNAVFQAVSVGEKDYIAIAIYVDSLLSFPPCGACRQVLAEFAHDMTVYIVNKTTVVETTLAALLPDKFTLHNE